jgi:hypothetical protein
MSTKTLRKRIALVAASALTAGVLSVIATPSANAFDTEDGYMDLTTGSVGLLASTIASNAYDTTKSAVLLKTGTLTVRVQSTSGGATLVVSSGAAITATSGAATTITADQTCVALADAGTATITPTGAVGSTFTVSVYSDNACGTAASLTERATVTIAGTDLSGVPVAANSNIYWAADGATTASSDDPAYAADVTGGILYVYVSLKDAYSAPVTAQTGALIATASSGANTKIAATGNTTGGTNATSVSTADPSALWVAVSEATAGAGWNGTVTISYNNVVLATKSGKISGKASKLTIAPLKVGKNDGAANAAALSYQVTDNAGNNIAIGNSSIVYSDSSNTTLVSAAAGDGNNSTTAAGTATFTCASGLTGTSDLEMKTTLTDGTVIKSNKATVRCGGQAAAYTASWDKATYSQGDIAKLTVKFTDLTGAAANSYDAVSASTNQVITANQMERVTAHAAAATPNSASSLEYTFTVGTSSGIVAGKYNAVISYPTVNTAGAAIKTGNSSAAYEIVAPASVSNADVLKSIVSLIASINKQIQALQKLILRR